MSSLKDLERDVHQFLINLAHVRRVDVKATVTGRGKKRVKATTFLDSEGRDNRSRVSLTEQHLMERHRNVDFDFSCATLKEEHEQRSVGTS